MPVKTQTLPYLRRRIIRMLLFRRLCPRKPRKGRRRKRKRLRLRLPRKRLNLTKPWQDVCNWKSSADTVKPAQTHQLVQGFNKLARLRVAARVTPRNRGPPRRLCRCQKDSKDRRRPEGIQRRHNLGRTRTASRHHRLLVRHHPVLHRLVRPRER